VKAIKVGKVTITAKAGDKTATCEVTVKPIPVIEIALDKTTAELVEGESLTIVATVSPDNATDKTVTWSTSDVTIATVDNNGVVKAIKVGKVTITAEAGGLTATCEITVVGKETDGIDEVITSGNLDIYDIRGRLVKKSATSLDALPKGIYIVNGKKISVK
jgi:alpha-L-fucosidase 2